MTRTQSSCQIDETRRSSLRLRFRRAMVGTLVAAFTVSSLNLPAIAYAAGLDGTSAEAAEQFAEPAEDELQANTPASTEEEPSDEGAEAAAAAEDEADTAKVSFKVADAVLTYTDAEGKEHEIKKDRDDVELASDVDFEFTVKANDGFDLSRVVLVAADKDATEIELKADEGGTYTVKADKLVDGLTVKVETEEHKKDFFESLGDFFLGQSSEEEAADEQRPAEDAAADDAATEDASNEDAVEAGKTADDGQAADEEQAEPADENAAADQAADENEPDEPASDEAGDDQGTDESDASADDEQAAAGDEDIDESDISAADETEQSQGGIFDSIAAFVAGIFSGSSAEQNANIATLSLDVEGSIVTLTNADGEEQKISESQDIEVAEGEDLALAVEPAEDNGSSGDQDVEVTVDGALVVPDEDGIYIVSASKVVNGMKLTAVAGAADELNNLAKTSVLLNTELPVPVTIRYYNTQNQVEHEENTDVTSGVLEDMAPEKDGYYFLDATISTDNVPIAYAEMHDDGKVYYALEENALTGILLEGNETIYLNYKELGNSVRVHYTTSGEDRVDGNEVIGFPETATKGEAFSFQVALARGYEAVVSTGNQTIDPSAKASGVNTYSVTVNEESTVSVEFVKTRTVSFDPGVFNDSSYRYLYDNGEPRFRFLDNSEKVQTHNIGDEGADFSFKFLTTGGFGWQCNSLQINGIYLNVPHTRTEGASATTTLYSDAYGECVATLMVISVRSGEATYELGITGAKEDLKITDANLRGGSWSEVIPTADEGINFESSPNGDRFGEGGLNKPFATDAGSATGNTPAFRFSLKNGYKNLGVRVCGYNSDSGEVFNQVVDLPSADRLENITVEYQQGWRTETTIVATITNNGSGTYTIKYTNNSVYGDALQLQFVEITCEKATYGVKYELGAGTGQISDSNTYDVVDNTTAVVTNRMPEAPEGQIFLGWKIKGNKSGPSYAVGDALDFTNDDIFRYVENGDGERDGYLTFVAMYTDEIAYGSSRPVNVKYFFENEDGKFVEDEEIRTAVQGVAGKQLSMLQHENTLEHDGYEYMFDADASKTTIVVTGDNAIELRYTLERVDYTYNAGEGGSVDPANERVIAQKEGAARGSVATANRGYKFDGWYVNDGGKDVKITEENADDYNVKLSDDGTKLVPQRHNGKYEGGTFTAKFEQKQGKVRYNLTLDGATWVGGVPSSMEAQPDKNGFYVEKERYSRNDTFTVTSAVPQCEGYVFVGWFDKDRTNTPGGDGATIRTADSDVKYIYEGDSQPYTLDALWVSIDAQGGTDTYNGQDHFIAAESAFEAGNLKDAEDSDYLGEIAQAGLVSFGDMEYRYKEGWRRMVRMEHDESRAR